MVYIDETFFTENVIEIVLHLIDTVVGIILLIIAIIGIKGFEKIKEKRYNVAWDFYTNLETYLYRLRLELNIDRSNAARYLCEAMPTAPKDKLEVNNFRSLAKDFLKFLSNGTGQIPATDNFDEWEKNRFELVTFLDTMCYTGLRVDFVVATDTTGGDKIEMLKIRIAKIMKIIVFFEREIKLVKSKLKKEINKRSVSEKIDAFFRRLLF